MILNLVKRGGGMYNLLYYDGIGCRWISYSLLNHWESLSAPNSYRKPTSQHESRSTGDQFFKCSETTGCKKKREEVMRILSKKHEYLFVFRSCLYGNTKPMWLWSECPTCWFWHNLAPYKEVVSVEKIFCKNLNLPLSINCPSWSGSHF